ncbi:MAG: hypothetical protein JNM68_10230 [Dinghuibacter sp.]|nr:hypothetical protein [Dinghuibacter sp.]
MTEKNIPLLPGKKTGTKSRATRIALLMLITSMAIGGIYAPDALQHVLVIATLLIMIRMINGKKEIF